MDKLQLNVLFTNGTIGGFSLSATAFSATNFELDPNGKRITLGSETVFSL